MGTLHKRIAALEGAAGKDGWADILDQLPDADLFRLEAIICGMGDTVSEEELEALPDADAEFLARILAMRG